MCYSRDGNHGFDIGYEQDLQPSHHTPYQAESRKFLKVKRTHKIETIDGYFEHQTGQNHPPYGGSVSVGFRKSIMESKKRKLTYKNHEKRGHVQGLIPPPNDYINKGKPEKEHVEDYPHHSFESFRILTSYEKV